MRVHKITKWKRTSIKKDERLLQLLYILRLIRVENLTLMTDYFLIIFNGRATNRE